MSKNELFQLLTSRVARAGSRKNAAKELGISPQYLGDVLHCRREISSSLAFKLGYERIVTFKQICPINHSAPVPTTACGDADDMPRMKCTLKEFAELTSAEDNEPPDFSELDRHTTSTHPFPLP